MEKTREEFITFVRQAMNDKESGAAFELYQFLVNIYVKADVKLHGRVYPDQFDPLVEEAVKLPRLYGFAPKNEDMFPNDQARKEARLRQFKEMDSDCNGYITLEEWVKFAADHILIKSKGLPKDYLGGTSTDVSKEEFLAFIKKAVVKGTPEFRELYYFLLKNFQRGDVNHIGSVTPEAFDAMIEDAAAAPRRFGLAPSSKELFKNDQERLAKRKEYFEKMDTNKNGLISFNEWLNYALEHIMGKVAQL